MSHPDPNLPHPGQSPQERVAARIEEQVLELEAEIARHRKQTKDWCRTIHELDPHDRLPLAEFNDRLNVLERLSVQAEDTVKLLGQKRDSLLASAATLLAQETRPQAAHQPLRFLCIPFMHEHRDFASFVTCSTGGEG